ncbi:LmbE-like protein [Aspergillus steynii IBT 23096]|uniref:N-acetylglucosaminylphosphatidylinositol deacetylase n=1 Tax=Aspergillus steynii IBT 23096 TaxID=1392250 RepID=A0A2I2GIS4_9EURO|nr:LmbE-like protein [Aspergillus steynii IBT 23096]PLB52780.1 LmbE-like protein [Aspergillus steynii IBT 23096]
MLNILKHLLRRIGRRPLTIITTLLATSTLIALILYHLLGYLLANNPRIVSPTFRRATSILFVTAHPDDETLFFSPTLLYREDDPGVEKSLLVLSSGNYDGVGSTRQSELKAACAVAGIKASRCVGLDHFELQDDPKKWWSEELIAEMVREYVTRWGVDLIVTFDDGGISGHLNHRAVAGGVRKYIQTNPHSHHPAYALQTKSLLRKYAGLLDLIPTSIPFTWRIMGALFASAPAQNAAGDTYGDHVLLVSPWGRYFQGRRAFRAHWSQYSWDRGFYLVFSRYMWMNDLRRIS